MTGHREERAAAILAKVKQIKPMIGLFASDADVKATAALIDSMMPAQELPTRLVGPMFDRWMAEAENPRAFPPPAALRIHLRLLKQQEVPGRAELPAGPAPKPAWPDADYRAALDEVWTEMGAVSPSAALMLEGPRALARHRRAATLSGPEGGDGRPLGRPRHDHESRRRAGLLGCGDGCPSWEVAEARKLAMAEVLANLPTPRTSTSGCSCIGGVRDAEGDSGVYPCPRCNRDAFDRWQEGGYQP